MSNKETTFTDREKELIRYFIYDLFEEDYSDEPEVIRTVAAHADELACGAWQAYEKLVHLFYDGVPDVLEPDREKAVQLAHTCLKHPPRYIGGIDLVSYVESKDSLGLFLGDCYRDGNGTEQDMMKALEFYLVYHTDHLTHKWARNQMGDRMFKLFDTAREKLQKNPDDETAKIVLANMYYYGYGCNPSIKMALDYFGVRYDEARSSFPYVWGTKADVKTGDKVSFGRYDNQSIFWRVRAVEDGRALLLSDKIIESSYATDNQISCSEFEAEADPRTAEVEAWLKQTLLHDEYDSEEYDVKDGMAWDGLSQDEESYLLTEAEADAYGKKAGFFLLTGEEVKRFFPEEGSAIAYLHGRLDPYAFGIDTAYNSPDDEGYAASWWIATEDPDDEDCPNLVDEEGDMIIDDFHGWAGIRPAVWVKVKK